MLGNRVKSEESIVVTTAATQTMPLSIKSHTRNNHNIDISICSEGFTYRLHQMKDALLQIMSTCVATNLHILIVEYLRQKYLLALGQQIVEQLVGVDLIRQGIISQNCLSLRQSRLQTGDNGKRQFFQLLWCELSLDLSYLSPQVVLIHKQSKML